MLVVVVLERFDDSRGIHSTMTTTTKFSLLLWMVEEHGQHGCGVAMERLLRNDDRSSCCSYNGCERDGSSDDGAFQNK
jgi:hypothetical protein